MVELLNTKAVAEYLGINEKQVYYLAKAGRLPCTRVTGKWLFPKKLVDEWIEEKSRSVVRKKPSEQRNYLIAAGSDDPSLGILRDQFSSCNRGALFMATVGSSAGLATLREGVTDFALAHLVDPGTGEYNLPFLEESSVSQVAVVQLFRRDLGLLLPPGNPLQIKTLADLIRPKVRMINRQTGSGTRHYIDHEFAKLGIDPKTISGYEQSVMTHFDAGLKILKHEADVAVACRATAHLLGLHFVPLTQERFDILIPRERFFFPAIQSLLETVGSREYRHRVEAMGGYDTSESGRLIAHN
jgi:excisionase family DNA binding protein